MVSEATESPRVKMLSALAHALDWLCLAAALGLAGYGQREFRHGDWVTGVLAFAGAMILFAWAIRRVQTPEPATRAQIANDTPLWQRWAGLVLIALSGSCIISSLVLFGLAPPTNLGWSLYLASMALLALGFTAIEWKPTRGWWLAQLSRLRDARWELFFLFVLVAGGGVLRFSGLDIVPFGVWYDESDNAVWAREILLNPTFRPLYVSSTNLPSHFLYLIALSFKWFGVTASALRFVTAFFGTATIVAMWLLGRELGGRWMGLLAAGLVTVSHWCINFSRLGMHGVTTPFFAATSAYWLLRGLRTGSRMTVALGGLALGLGLCFYAPFRLFPFVIVLFWAGKCLCEKGFFQRGWKHIIVFVVASFVAFAPVAQYALQHPQEFFGRTKQTSLFTGKTPEQAVQALKSNIRRHLLMFNYEGDRNGRHNLPGEPMLDPLAGPWLPLGLALALARLHRPRQLLLVGWFAIMLSAGILSLDFEAPQSLRSIGTIPAVFLLIAQAVSVSVQELLKPLRGLRWPRRAAEGLATLAVAGGFVYSGMINFDIYFVRQPRDPGVFHSYNAREAITARRLVADGDKYRVYSIYVGHPTIRFLAPNPPDHRPFQPIDDLPVRGLVDRDVLYIMEPEFAPPTDLFTVWYPHGLLEWYVDPLGSPMLYTYEVKKDAVNEAQGARLRLFDMADHSQSSPLNERRTDHLGGRWDELSPGRLVRGEWTGQVFAPFSGTYIVHLHSTGTASLILDDRTLQLPEGGDIEEARVLVKGWHPVRLVADAVAGGEVLVEWTKPDGTREVIPREALNVHPGLEHGLYAHYYQGMDWSGMPVFGRVDWQVDFRWHVQPLPTPFSVEWQGGLKIDEPGSYVLAINSNSGAMLELNGVVLIDSLEPPHGHKEVTIHLDKGIYPIRVRYHEADGYSLMRLQWRPPHGLFGAIPAENLVPKLPEGAAVPGFKLPEPEAPAAPPKPAMPMEEVPEVQAELVRTFGRDAGLERPRGIAVGADGRVYVSDAGKQAIVVFDANGKLLGTWGKGKLQDPSDLAVTPAGVVYVIDAGISRIVPFDANGTMLPKLGEQAGFYSPRGLALSPQGDLVIADTGSNRVVVLRPDGQIKAVFGMQGKGPGQFDQPADVAVGPDGTILVADTLLNKRVQIFTPEGLFLSYWLAPWSSDFAAPATAVGSDGRIYMADTDHGRVWEYAAGGTEPVWWRGGDMKRPVGLALDSREQIYLVDEETKAVYVFKRIR